MGEEGRSNGRDRWAQGKYQGLAESTEGASMRRRLRGKVSGPLEIYLPLPGYKYNGRCQCTGGTAFRCTGDEQLCVSW